MPLGELANNEQEDTPHDSEEDYAENDDFPGMRMRGAPQDCEWSASETWIK